MGSTGQDSQRLFCWTICAYRKPGMAEDDYHRYMTEIHAPLVKGLMVKYGMIRFSMTHNTTSTKPMMEKIAGPQFDNFSDYDCIVNVVFPDVENFVRMKMDPYYIEKVLPDHENYADTARSRMSVGWIEDHVRSGKVID